KPINDLSKEFPDMNLSGFYDLKKLKIYFNQLDTKKIKKDLRDKESYYREAKDILEVILSKQHTKQEFKELLESLVGKAKAPGLWYSNGMFRGKEKIFSQQRKFRALLANIKGNLNKSPQTIYEEARSISLDIPGLGPNYIGEIMMT